MLGHIICAIVTITLIAVFFGLPGLYVYGAFIAAGYALLGLFALMSALS